MVPVLPATGLFSALILQPVPSFTTACRRSVITAVVSGERDSVNKGWLSSRIFPFLSTTLVIKIGFTSMPLLANTEYALVSSSRDVPDEPRAKERSALRGDSTPICFA
ncbi:hypothetical protein ES703_104342 [subsurface metagenome]